MTKKFELNRRTFLRGAGGIALGLPMLEAMVNARPAYAQGDPPKRYVVMTSGQSTGRDDTPEVFFVPSAVGPLKGQTMPTGLAGLSDLVADFTLVSGLQIPSIGLDGYTSIPPGGKPAVTHDATLSPLLSGKASVYENFFSQGATSDFLVAQKIAQTTAFKQLVYRVQLDEINGHFAEISYSGANTPVNNSLADPAVAFQTLFGSFVPPSSGSAAPDPAIERRNKRRRSVLDSVLKSAADLEGRLGVADRKRLSDHLDQIRSLELRIERLGSSSGATPQCSKPKAPTPFQRGASYNDEIKRGEVLVDLITMAFACDLSRVASLLISFSMPMFTLPSHTGDVHEEGHSGGQTGRNEFVASHAWHLSHFGRLLRGLKALKEGTGTVLDNTAVVFAFEAGHGRDAVGGTLHAHSTDNMVMLVGGSAGGKLKTGQHIRPATSGTHQSGAAKPRHPASVLMSCMTAVGVPTTTLGDITGSVAELLV